MMAIRLLSTGQSVQIVLKGLIFTNFKHSSKCHDNNENPLLCKLHPMASGGDSTLLKHGQLSP